MFTEPVDQAAIDKSRKMLRSTFEKMDAELAGQPWLSGETYSLADIAAAPVVDRVQILELSDVWDGLDALRNWIDRLTSRPAYRRALPKERMRDMLN